MKVLLALIAALVATHARLSWEFDRDARYIQQYSTFRREEFTESPGGSAPLLAKETKGRASVPTKAGEEFTEVNLGSAPLLAKEKTSVPTESPEGSGAPISSKTPKETSVPTKAGEEVTESPGGTSAPESKASKAPTETKSSAVQSKVPRETKSPKPPATPKATPKAPKFPATPIPTKQNKSSVASKAPKTKAPQKTKITIITGGGTKAPKVTFLPTAPTSFLPTFPTSSKAPTVPFTPTAPTSSKAPATSIPTKALKVTKVNPGGEDSPPEGTSPPGPPTPPDRRMGDADDWTTAAEEAEEGGIFHRIFGF